jgi:diguanylate cyclase (GGDEF)-like protein
MAMELRKLLIGLDFSPPALAAAEWVGRQLGPEAKLILAHCVYVPEAPRFLRDVLQPRDAVLARASAEAEKRMEEFRRTLPADAPATVVREGKPAEAIAELAREQSADLIVVADRFPAGRSRGPVGATAEQLLRCAPVPVLLARNLPAGPPRRILVPVDDSEHAARVLGWGRALADRFDAAVIAFHALSPGLYGMAGAAGSPDEVARMEAELDRRAREWLRERLRTEGFPDGRVSVHVAHGDPVYEIVAAAEESDADMIVMGSHRRDAVSRLLLGSYRKIEHSLATVDQLTQVYNRRYFFSVCPELMRANLDDGEQHNPAIILLKIANLPDINQSQGFDIGDNALTHVGRSLQRYVRGHNITARLSGRTFAIFLPDATFDEAENLTHLILERSRFLLIHRQEDEDISCTLDLHHVYCSADANQSFEQLVAHTKHVYEKKYPNAATT